MRTTSSAPGGADRRAFLRRLGFSAGAFGLSRSSLGQQSPKAPAMAFKQTDEALQLRMGNGELLRYQVKKPARGGASVESGCYIHPLATPGGTVVTEVAPADHPHHRGVFLGWVEMHGKKDADFWGWGEHAPIAKRRIVNRMLQAPPIELGFPRFRAVNDWLAESEVLLKEDMRITVIVRDGCTILDIAVQLSVPAPVRLARWAFGGFAVRTRKDGQVTPVSESGPFKRTAPKHTDPASNWPDAPWYGLHLKLKGGKEATVAVVGRAENPPTTWHVVPEIGLINPCITAPGELRLVPEKPLVLRYRVIAQDGAPNLKVLNPLGTSWYAAAQ